MQLKPWFTSIWHRFAGRDPLIRRHVLFCLGSAQLYLVSIGVLWHGTHLDLVDEWVARSLSLAMACVWSVFFVLIRSGWSSRLADPLMSLPHAMLSILITVGAYAMLGNTRNDVILLLGQTIAVTMFRIRPRESLFLGLWTVGCLCLTQFALVWLGPEAHNAIFMAAQSAVTSATLLALALVAMWISQLRQKIARGAQKLRATLDQVQALATTDMLTGLLNRRQLEVVMMAELQLARRQGHALCVAVVDLDHFKRVNDLYGHRMGDEVLRRFAALLQTELRQADRVGRWGGEEFVILMPHVDLAQAHMALERIRKRLADLPMSEHEPLRVTVSGGVAAWSHGLTMEPWLEQADQALYQAKARGRNRIVAAPEPSPRAVLSLPPRPPTELPEARELGFAEQGSQTHSGAA